MVHVRRVSSWSYSFQKLYFGVLYSHSIFRRQKIKHIDASILTFLLFLTSHFFSTVFHLFWLTVLWIFRIPEANSTEQLLRLVDCHGSWLAMQILRVCKLGIGRFVLLSIVANLDALRQKSRAKNSIRELHARGIVRLISIKFTITLRRIISLCTNKGCWHIH